MLLHHPALISSHSDICKLLCCSADLNAIIHAHCSGLVTLTATQRVCEQQPTVTTGLHVVQCFSKPTGCPFMLPHRVCCLYFRARTTPPNLVILCLQVPPDWVKKYAPLLRCLRIDFSNMCAADRAAAEGSLASALQHASLTQLEKNDKLRLGEFVSLHDRVNVELLKRLPVRANGHASTWVEGLAGTSSVALQFHCSGLLASPHAVCLQHISEPQFSSLEFASSSRIW